MCKLNEKRMCESTVQSVDRKEDRHLLSIDYDPGIWDAEMT